MFEYVYSMNQLPRDIIKSAPRVALTFPLVHVLGSYLYNKVLLKYISTFICKIERLVSNTSHSVFFWTTTKKSPYLNVGRCMIPLGFSRKNKRWIAGTSRKQFCQHPFSYVNCTYLGQFLQCCLQINYMGLHLLSFGSRGGTGISETASTSVTLPPSTGRMSLNHFESISQSEKKDLLNKSLFPPHPQNQLTSFLSRGISYML